MEQSPIINVNNVYAMEEDCEKSEIDMVNLPNTYALFNNFFFNFPRSPKIRSDHL